MEHLSQFLPVLGVFLAGMIFAPRATLKLIWRTVGFVVNLIPDVIALVFAWI